MWRCLTLLATACTISFNAYTQEASYWPSPEVEQMYKQAKDYLAAGAVKQSIVLLQQAIQLAPDVMLLHRDLAQALNLANEYNEAYRTIEPVIKSGQADEQAFQTAGSALLGAGEKKKAKNILEKGIKSYPHSGVLYHELGRYYESNNELEYALDSWLQGIEADPVYHLNYYEAARIYAGTDKLIWTIIYGEMFVNLERHTTRSMETRKWILDAYKRVFATIGTKSVPKYGRNTTKGESANFETAVMQTLLQLSPVVSDGITTENLTMLRTRFLIDWMANFAARYSFTLFTYQDKLIRDGEFDAYNQWLFGVAENESLYNSWTKFHKDAIPQYENWTRTNRFQPTASDVYNDKDLRTLFTKKKNG